MISVYSKAICGEIWSFKKTYLNTCQDNDIFFIKGIAGEVYEHGRTIKIIEDLKGNLGDKSSIFVWGIGGNCYFTLDGMVCYEEHRTDNIIQYNENDTLIMLVGNPRVFEGGIETYNDYATLGCASSVLKLSNGFVTGRIDNWIEDNTMAWEELQADLQALCNPTTNCGTIEINENEYVTMQIVPEKVSSSSSNKFRLENHTETEMWYDSESSLEYYSENQWIPIPIQIDNINLIKPVYFLSAGETLEEQTVDMYSFINEYNNEQKGKYRIIKKVALINDIVPPSDVLYTLCAEFEIVDDNPASIQSINTKNNIYQWNGTIFFDNPENKDVKLSFYDLSGKLVHQAITTSNSYRPILAGNIFVCKININDEIHTIKYIVP